MTPLATLAAELLPAVVAAHPDFTAVEARAWARSLARRELHVYPTDGATNDDALREALTAALAAVGLRCRTAHAVYVPEGADDFSGRVMEAQFRCEVRLYGDRQHYWAGAFDGSMCREAVAARVAESVAGGGPGMRKLADLDRQQRKQTARWQ